ncbi:MAG: cytochrome c biogenesis protein CcsA [Acidobacteriaceae bacterium]|jgi:ABC-type uncharacterized transport system permease subunit
MALLWLQVAAVLYAAGSVAVFPAVLYKNERWRSICLHLAGMGFFFHFVSVVEMLAQAHRWMPVGLREAESLLGFLLAGLFFLAWWLYDAISLGIFALPVTFFLVFVPALGLTSYTFPSEGVRSGWLIAHITALLAASAALCFSLIASILYLAQERRIKQKMKASENSWRAPLDWLPPLDPIDRIAHIMLLFGFPCMTIGLLLGAVLVQETPLGAAYFLDPKVIASFAMWCVYVLLLYLRHRTGLRGRKAAYLSGAVLVATLVVWVANLVSHVRGFGAP